MPKESSSSTEAAPQLDRSALLEKARAFLLSPGIHNENEQAKRRFLEEKGLTGEEIGTLIRNLVPQPPPIPPRTYPPPPPSNLPTLLASLFRAITWITGASGVLVFCYYRFVLPRLSQSLAARHKLKLHQYELLAHLRDRINELNANQVESYESISLPEHNDPPADIKASEDLHVNSAGEPSHSLGIVVRCAFSGMTPPKLTLDELYQRLLKQFPGLKAADEAEYKHFVLRELSRSDLFENVIQGDTEYWLLREDKLSEPKRLTSSIILLQNLRDEISRGKRKPNAYQHTFKSLTDLTAYISRETYAMYGMTSGFRYGLSGTQPLAPAEEDVRREIRALKGLVLNRRTFASTPYRSSLAPASPITAVG